MKIIKEIRLERVRPNPNDPDAPPWTDTAIGVVRSDCDASSIDYIKLLVEAARETYPHLPDSAFSVKQYGGERYKRTFGVEFNLPAGATEAPEGWMPISELEPTL